MQLAKRNDFPADTAGKVYDVKDAAEQNVKLLREDLAITDEQRQEALKELRNQTEQTIKDTLGEPLYQRYLNSGGGWIRNVAAPLPSSRVSPLE
jgi:protein involved in temperature-dependent protein secretion